MARRPLNEKNFSGPGHCISVGMPVVVVVVVVDVEGVIVLGVEVVGGG